jgi:hypothetical protein
MCRYDRRTRLPPSTPPRQSPHVSTWQETQGHAQAHLAHQAYTIQGARSPLRAQQVRQLRRPSPWTSRTDGTDLRSILLAIAGRNDHVRVYALNDIRTMIEQKKSSVRDGYPIQRDPVVLPSNSKGKGRADASPSIPNSPRRTTALVSPSSPLRTQQPRDFVVTRRGSTSATISRRASRAHLDGSSPPRVGGRTSRRGSVQGLEGGREEVVPPVPSLVGNRHLEQEEEAEVLASPQVVDRRESADSVVSASGWTTDRDHSPVRPTIAADDSSTTPPARQSRMTPRSASNTRLLLAQSSNTNDLVELLRSSGPDDPPSPTPPRSRITRPASTIQLRSDGPSVTLDIAALMLETGPQDSTSSPPSLSNLHRRSTTTNHPIHHANSTSVSRSQSLRVDGRRPMSPTVPVVRNKEEDRLRRSKRWTINGVNSLFANRATGTADRSIDEEDPIEEVMGLQEVPSQQEPPVVHVPLASTPLPPHDFKDPSASRTELEPPSLPAESQLPPDSNPSVRPLSFRSRSDTDGHSQSNNALEYVKLARTKGSRMMRVAETKKRTYLAVLCGDEGERIELFTVRPECANEMRWD